MNNSQKKTLFASPMGKFQMLRRTTNQTHSAPVMKPAISIQLNVQAMTPPQFWSV